MSSTKWGTVQNLDSGLNNRLNIWTRILIARGQRSLQINQQQIVDMSSLSVSRRDNRRDATNLPFLRQKLSKSMCFLKSQKHMSACGLT